MNARFLARLGGVLVLATLGLGAAPAAAETPAQCMSAFLDQSGKVDESAALKDAIEDAAVAGALVRVRVYDSVGGDIEKKFADELATCESWRSPSGGRRANLLWVGVAIGDRKTGVEYGEAHTSRLDDHWLAVTTQKMNPQFRTGAYTEGVASGVEALTALIEGPVGGVSAGAPAASEDSAAGGGGISGSAVLGVAGGLVGLGVLGVGGVGIQRGVRGRRRRLELLAAAAGSARSAKQEASTRYLGVEGRSARVLAEAELVMGQVSDADDVEIASLALEARGLTGAAGAAMSAAAEGPDPSGSHTHEVYETITAAYQEADEAAEEAGAALDALESHCQVLSARLQDLDDTISAQQEQCDQVEAGLTKAAKAGWSVTSGKEALEAIRTELQEAAAQFEASCIGAASACSEEAGAALSSLEAWVEGLGRELHRLTSTHKTLQGEMAALTPRLTACEQELERMRSRHSREDACRVEGVLSGAQVQLSETSGALSACSITKDTSSWVRAEETLTAVSSALAKIGSQCGQVEAHAALLAKLSRTMEARLAGVEQAIAKVETYAATSTGTGEWSERELDEARTASASGRKSWTSGELLAADAACSRGEAAVAAADRSVRADRTEQDRREQAAKRAIREAEAKLAASQSYVSRNRSRAGSRATSGLSESERLLRDAQSSSNLVLALQLAAQAMASAESAERAARSAVEEAERAERARQASSSSSSSSSSYGGSSYGGGGSSDWGSSSSSDGGGGSSSW